MLSGLHSLHLPVAAATSPKAANLAVYYLCLNHPGAWAALLISMHPDGSQPPSLAAFSDQLAALGIISETQENQETQQALSRSK